jgi:hypothetical protein
VYIIHLMSASERNILFCFPESLDVSRDEVEGNIEIRGKTKLTISRGNRQLSVLFYSGEPKSTFNNIHTSIQQLYFVTKTLSCKILKKLVAFGAGNTHNLVARGHFSLAHIKLDKNKRMKLNEPQQNRCLFNC